MHPFDAFVATTLQRQIEAEEALPQRRPGSRLAMWSTHDPVTLFGG